MMSDTDFCVYAASVIIECHWPLRLDHVGHQWMTLGIVFALRKSSVTDTGLCVLAAAGTDD